MIETDLFYSDLPFDLPFLPFVPSSGSFDYDTSLLTSIPKPLPHVSFDVSDVFCSDPRIILNPSARFYLPYTKCYYCSGSVVYLSDYGIDIYQGDKFSLSPRKLGVTAENFQNFTFLNPHNGELLPLFLAVPCGHCALCNKHKRSQWMQRAMAETQCYDHLPLFVTLTYNNENLPSSGVQKNELQKFMKRLRIHLFRKFGYRDPLRYVACGEYGHKFHRPHYHLVLWNMPFEHLDYSFHIRDYYTIISDCWRFGFINVKCVTSNASLAAGYVTSYVKKLDKVPDGKNEPFFLASRGKNGYGAIGAPFVDKFRSFRENIVYNGCIRFKDRFASPDAPVSSLPLSGYLLDRILPSISKATPYKFKVAFRDICDNLDKISALDYRYRPLCYRIYDSLKQYHFIPHWFHLREIGTCRFRSTVEKSHYLSSFLKQYAQSCNHIVSILVPSLLNKVNKLINFLSAYCPKTDEMNFVNNLRMAYLHNLSLKLPIVDKNIESNRYLRDITLQLERSVF